MSPDFPARRSVGLGGNARAFVAFLALAACSRASERTASGPPPQLPAQRARHVAPAPADWYWEPVLPSVRGSGPRPIDGMVPEASIARAPGTARIWSDLRADGRERLRRDGIVVLGSAPSDRPATRSMGVFYTELRDQGVPYVVTLDALFSLVDLGLERALAEIEDTDFAPAFDAFITKLEARLGAEESGASVELASAYAIAHGLVAVACSLSNPKYAPPRALASVVADERGRVEAHAGQATSPLLGVPLDYARFTVPSGASRSGAFRALAWLAGAPIALVARGEEPGAIVSVYEARRNTRAAMLLARLVDREVDLGIFALYSRIKRLLSFVSGPSDDVSLLELDEIAGSVSIDLTKPASIANVVHVDRVRNATRMKRAPSLYDGSGSPPRGGLSVRLFGGHAPADSLALQALIGPAVGTAREGASVERVREGRRVLPSTLDVAAWLGAPEARALLKETAADAFEGFDAALTSASSTRPDPESPQLHASVHGSLVDALAAWADPSSRFSSIASQAAERSRVESLLAAWTVVRHAGQPLSRPKPAPARALREARTAGSPIPVFVEAAPDVFARLVSTVRQIRRGLVALGPLAATSPSHALLVEIEDVLQVALHAAERLTGGEPLTQEEGSALALLPSRIANVEESAGLPASPASPAWVVVARDPVGRRVLISAAGVIEPAVVLVRESGSGGLVLAVGAHIAHHEKVVSYEKAEVSDVGRGLGVPDQGHGQSRPSDVGVRPSWVASFRMVR